MGIGSRIKYGAKILIYIEVTLLNRGRLHHALRLRFNHGRCATAVSRQQNRPARCSFRWRGGKVSRSRIFCGATATTTGNREYGERNGRCLHRAR